MRMTIEGHCDERGSTGTAWHWATTRANRESTLVNLGISAANLNGQLRQGSRSARSTSLPA
jgi:hypothetical protein